MKKLTTYGVAGLDFKDIEKAKAYTYDTRDKTFPPTPLIIKENPFNQEIKNAKNILEIGCGVGRNFPWISENLPNAEYHGVDPNESMLSFFLELNRDCSKKPNLHKDFCTIPNEIQFDIVLCTFVFQHISYRPQPPQMNIDDITTEAMKRAHKDTIFFFIEHDKEEPGWIDKWFINNKIIPDVYIRDWTTPGRSSVKEMNDRGTHDLIIFKHEKSLFL